MKEIMEPTISDKGIAVLAAIESGLISKTADGADTCKFEKFWSLYHEGLSKHRLQQINELTKMLNYERKGRACDCAYYRRKYRNISICSLVGAFLGSILTLLFQALQ